MNIGYIASTIIAGIFLISLIALNLRVSQNSGEQTLYIMAKIQNELVVDMFKHDLRSMGYRIDSGSPIVAATTDSLKFQVHFEGNENPTEIGWKFDSDSGSSNANSNTRSLYRTVNGEEERISSVVSRFELEYLNADREVLNPVMIPVSQIHQIRLTLVTESTEGYGNEKFGRSFWTGELSPHNLN